ncbi:hypothetical protein BH11BAC6_BH11BAC6_11040 [soil metagenome]
MDLFYDFNKNDIVLTTLQKFSLKKKRLQTLTVLLSIRGWFAIELGN